MIEHNNMTKPNRLIEALIAVGGFFMLAGVVVYMINREYAQYMFMAGSLFFACGIIADQYKGVNRIMRRLRAQQVMGALFLLLTGMLMMMDGYRDYIISQSWSNDKIRHLILSITGSNYWIVTLFIGAIFELYSSIRMGKLSSELRENE